MNKYRLVALLTLLSVLTLTACEGNYVLNQATVVSKTIKDESVRREYYVTVEKNGSQYTYRVSKSTYEFANEGALIDIKQQSGSRYADFYPSERESEQSE